jgi:hypothetical protein
MSSEETAIDPEVLPAETKGKRKALAKREAPSDLLSVIAQAAIDPRCDVEKMERLMAMQRQVEEDRRKIVFMSALSRLQAEIPQIDKLGRVVVKGNLRSTFAKIEDIDSVVRPLCAKYGFAFSDDVKAIDGKTLEITCKLSHEDGHSETKSVPLPIDFNEYRTGSQSVMATITLAKRHLRKMHLNIVEKDADTDGNENEPITDEQARDIRTMLTDTKSDEAKFLALIAGVDKIESIPARDYKRVMNALETKARAQK